jgi:hypothetical protein
MTNFIVFIFLLKHRPQKFNIVQCWLERFLVLYVAMLKINFTFLNLYKKILSAPLVFFSVQVT